MLIDEQRRIRRRPSTSLSFRRYFQRQAVLLLKWGFRIRGSRFYKSNIATTDYETKSHNEIEWVISSENKLASWSLHNNCENSEKRR